MFDRRARRVEKGEEEKGTGGPREWAGKDEKDEVVAAGRRRRGQNGKVKLRNAAATAAVAAKVFPPLSLSLSLSQTATT